MFFWTCSREEKVSTENAEQPVVTDVQVASVQPETVEDSFEAVGTVKARMSTVLSSKTVGTIVAVMAQEGDRVRKGQILIEIDDRDLRADFQGAQAALEESHFGYRRRPISGGFGARTEGVSHCYVQAL
jgi:multidrug efflux pump subunit AcrA (membrane-fusion protein)